MVVGAREKGERGRPSNKVDFELSGLSSAPWAMSQGQGKAATVSIDEELLANGLTRYHLEPPSWRAPWLGTSQQAANYPQFYPTRDGQEEDQLTESAVKQGFSGKTVVGVSTSLAWPPHWQPAAPKTQQADPLCPRRPRPSPLTR